MKKYFKHKLQNLLVVNKIVTLHYFEFEKDFSYSDESHDFWEIVFADKGTAICTSNDEKIILSQGQMLFHKPNERHSLSCDGKNSAKIFIASFDCHSESMRFFENKVITLNKSQIKHVYAIIEESRRTFDILFPDPDMKKMTMLSKPTLGGEQIIKNHLELLLIDLMRSLTETESGNEIFLPEKELESKLVSDVMQILKSNVYGEINIDEICKRASYSKSHVFKQFKLATGKSVMDYYNYLKIKTAKQLLKEGDLSIKKIAEKLSFDTPNYFSKTFKKFTEMTPSQYKKSVSL
jgi:AraC-like DNA-binding protein/quercetin dioxygenase-like cupin family protein